LSIFPGSVRSFICRVFRASGIRCSLCGVSGRCAGLRCVQRLRLLGSWVDPVQLCGLILSGLVRSSGRIRSGLHGSRYNCGRIMSGCLPDLSGVQSVRLSSGPIACSRIPPGLWLLSVVEDPAGRRRSFRADSIPLPVSVFPALCPIMLPRFRRSGPGLLSVSAGPVRCPVFRGFQDPAEVHPPPKTEKPTVPLPEIKISPKTMPIGKVSISRPAIFLFIQFQLKKIGATRARVYDSCARYIVTSIPFR